MCNSAVVDSVCKNDIYITYKYSNINNCRGSFRIMFCYYYYMCFANYGASEAVNLGSRYMEKSTKYSEQNAPVILIFMMGQERQNRSTVSKLKVKNIYATLAVDSVQKAEMVFCSNYILRV
jgi:hypothetical protein